MSETRKAYRVNNRGELEEVTIVITPKRIAVQDTYARSYYEPEKFWFRYSGTPIDAWLRFLDETRGELVELRERTATAEEMIKKGEAYFDSISPFKGRGRPEDYQTS